MGTRTRDAVEDSLTDIKQADEHIVEGTTDIGPRTQVDGAHLHGAHTLVPVFRLSEKLLQPGERVIGIDEIRWSRVMTTSVHLAMSDEGGKLPRKNSDTTMSGVLRTNLERNLAFLGESTQRPFTRASSNRAVHLLVPARAEEIKASSNGISFSCPALGQRDFRELMSNPGVFAATMVDLITSSMITMAEVFQRDTGSIDPDGRALMVAVRNLPIPISPEIGSFKIETDFNTARETENSRIVPFSFWIGEQPGSGYAALQGGKGGK